MTAILENRKFVLVYPNDYYLLPRSEGRIKSYDSCNDIRAWSLHDCDRSDHLIDLIKINGDCCRGLIPPQALVDIMSSLEGGDRHKIDEGLTMKIDSPPREATAEVSRKEPIGDSEENERELKRIIAAKDKEIEALQREIEELKAKCKADLKNLQDQSANIGNSLEDSGLQEKNKQLQDEIKRLQDEMKRLKENVNSAAGCTDDKARIEELERMIRELTSERDTLRKTNADLANKSGAGSKDDKARIEELERIIRELTSERDKLQKTNADLAKDLEELRLQLENLNSLTKELNNYANKAHSMHGNGEKYHDLLEMFKVALDEDIAKAKTAAGELKKERKQLEKQIKSQLDEALEMYIAALEEIQKKQMEIDRLSKELKEMKSKNDELAKNCASMQNIKGDNRPEKPPEITKAPKGIRQDSSSQTELETYQPAPKPEGENTEKQQNKQTVSAPNSARSPAPSYAPRSGYQNMCEMNKCTAKCRSTNQRMTDCCPYCERRNTCISSTDFRSFSVSNAMSDAIKKLQNDLNAKHKRSNKTVTSQSEDQRHVKSKRITHENWDLTLPVPQTNSEIEIDSCIQQMMDLQVQFPDCSLMIRTGT